MTSAGSITSGAYEIAKSADNTRESIMSEIKNSVQNGPSGSDVYTSGLGGTETKSTEGQMLLDNALKHLNEPVPNDPKGRSIIQIAAEALKAKNDSLKQQTKNRVGYLMDKCSKSVFSRR
jgi:hypothetical protein